MLILSHDAPLAADLRKMQLSSVPGYSEQLADKTRISTLS